MFKKYILPNGLKVILSPLHETKAVTVIVLVKVGSRYETRQINGVSHFIEHLMFKGTPKRPTTLDISKELDGVGAEYNAFTSKDHTGYYVKANAEKIELALDILSDMLFNSKFESDEINRERGVIIEEINMYEDNPLMLAEDVFEGTVYGDCPLGWNIAGSRATIEKVSRSQIVEYLHRYYHPRNMLLAVAGQYDGSLPRLIEKYFGGHGATQPRASKKVAFAKASGRQTSPHLHLKFKETEQVQLTLGFPAYSYFEKKLYPLYLLSVILGGNMSSRLFTSIREKKGLCYFIRSSVNVYEDTGNLMIQAGLDKKRIKEAIVEIIKEFKKVKTAGVTAAELRNAKDFSKGKLILDLEASDHVASWLSRQQLLTGKILTPTDQMKLIERVTLADIKNAAREIIQSPKLNLALIGPYQRESEFRGLLKM